MTRPAAGGARWLLGGVVGGALVLALMWLLVGSSHASAIDRAGFDALAVSYTSRLGRNAHEVANAIGGGGVTITIVALVYAARSGRRALAVALVAGFVIAYGLGDVIKAIEDRPRPVGELIAAGGASFPSTDSAISVGFVMVAAVLARGFDHRVSQLVVVAIGVIVCVIAGLLTVAFRDHFLSDVLGGWALGVATFCACAWLAESRTARPAAGPS